MRDRLIKFVALANAILAILAILVSTAVLTRSTLAPAPFAYSSDAYPPHAAALCPGALLAWQSITHVNDAPVTVLNSRSIWSIEQNRTVVAARTGDRTELTWPYTTTITSTAVYTLPQTLAPGHYLLMSSAAARHGSADAIYRVPFQIVPCGATP